jgi:hypothetical protein
MVVLNLQHNSVVVLVVDDDGDDDQHENAVYSLEENHDYGWIWISICT